jgi:hypothetical protein
MVSSGLDVSKPEAGGQLDRSIALLAIFNQGDDGAGYGNGSGRPLATPTRLTSATACAFGWM